MDPLTDQHVKKSCRLSNVLFPPPNPLFHPHKKAYSKALNASVAAGLSPGVAAAGGVPGGIPPSLLAVASHHHSSPPGAHLLAPHPMAGALAPHPKPSSTYTSPPVAPNEPSCNECRLIEYRGAKIASFQVGGETVICLPQVSVRLTLLVIITSGGEWYKKSYTQVGSVCNTLPSGWGNVVSS